MNLDLYRRLIAGERLVYPLPGRSLWKLSGPDAERYLNGQITNDVTKLGDGKILYSAVCTAKGRMEGDLNVTRNGDAFYMDADPVLRESLGARLDKYLIADDAVLEDITEEWGVTHFFGLEAPSSPQGGFVVAHERFGLAGYDVWDPSRELTPGTKVDDDMVETVRLELGIPRWGAELNSSTLPPEGGPFLLAAISYTKGCYVGQETIARLKSVGHVNRTLVFMRASSAEFPAPATKILYADKEVGLVTSASYSPRLEKAIALGYVQRGCAMDGTVMQTGNVTLTIAPSLLQEKVT